ncbi:hypothetical protein GCM10009678_86290 [Actinomadura kijaniata]
MRTPPLYAGPNERPRQHPPVETNGELAVPLPLLLASTLAPASVGVLLHLVACPRCFTGADLHEHNVIGRAAAKTAITELIEKDYYRSEERPTRDGDQLRCVQIALVPGQFGPAHCLSWVYFVSRGGLIKIGTTAALSTRIRQLGYDGGPVTVEALITGGPVMEARFHQELARHRVHGEWFTDGPAVRRVIDQINKGKRRGARL